MSKDYFLSRTDRGKSDWANNFSAKLPFYAAKYGITPEEVAQAQQDAQVFAMILDYREQLNSYLAAITSLKNILRDGLKNGGTMEIPPPPPPMIMGPMLPGIFARNTALANRIKAHLNYNIADGNELGLEGVESTVDFNDLKPIISIRLVAGGHPEIVWKKKELDGIEIYKEDAQGDFQLLAFDSSPNYVDLSPLPPKGTAAVWRYRVIYRYKDQRVGQWSDVASIMVMG